MRIRVTAVMTDAKFGDTVSNTVIAEDGSCHAANIRYRPRFAGFAGVPAAAQEVRRSECLAMANAPPRATPVAFRRTAAKAEEVAITYAGHSTYYIDTPGGIRIATDYSGGYRTGRLPDVVTMNRAHSTHYTLFPDPKIPHVLHGWGDKDQPAHVNSASAMSISAMSPPTSAAITATSQRRDDQGRQFDLHLRGRGPLHRPSRASAPHARRQPFRRRSAGSTS